MIAKISHVASIALTIYFTGVGAYAYQCVSWKITGGHREI